MIAMILGNMSGVANATYWAPISGSNDFPDDISKELFRLDDGIGSGDVLIETSIINYSGVKLSAYEYAGYWRLKDYSYRWPRGGNRMITRNTVPYDFIPSDPHFPQVPNRVGWIVFPITIPAGNWGEGNPAYDMDFTCYAGIIANKWHNSDGYKPRFYVTLVGDNKVNDKYSVLRVNVDLLDAQFGRDVPLDTVWSTVASEAYMTSLILSAGGRNIDIFSYCHNDPNGKAVDRARSYILDFSTANASVLSPDKGEYSFWFGRATGVINNPDGIEPGLFASAFYKAQENLPEASQNQIANICDIVSAIRSFKEKPYLQIEKGSTALKNAWLAYRYSYSTTKSDILELASLSQRLLELGDVVKSFGSVSTSSARYFAEVVVDASYYMPSECTSLLRRLQQFGARVNAQNVWDMIPYSFIVDWFFDVSSLLHSFDNWIAASSIPIKEVWYSCVTSYDDGRRAYFRWLGDPPALPSWSYHISNSGGTWLKRLADAISLF